MRVLLAGLLLVATFSGCMGGEFRSLRDLSAGAEGTVPGACTPTVPNVDDFAIEARRNVTHVEVAFGGDVRALPFDDAMDVFGEAFRLMYPAAEPNLAILPPDTVEERTASNDHVAIAFSGAGVELPSACGAWSGPWAYFLLDETTLLACSEALECRETATLPSFDALRAAAEAAHAGLG